MAAVWRAPVGCGGVGVFCGTLYRGVNLTLRLLQDVFHLDRGLGWSVDLLLFGNELEKTEGIEPLTLLFEWRQHGHNAALKCLGSALKCSECRVARCAVFLMVGTPAV